MSAGMSGATTAASIRTPGTPGPRPMSTALAGSAFDPSLRRLPAIGAHVRVAVGLDSRGGCAGARHADTAADRSGSQRCEVRVDRRPVKPVCRSLNRRSAATPSRHERHSATKPRYSALSAHDLLCRHPRSRRPRDDRRHPHQCGARQHLDLPQAARLRTPGRTRPSPSRPPATSRSRNRSSASCTRGSRTPKPGEVERCSTSTDHVPRRATRRPRRPQGARPSTAAAWTKRA